MQYLKCVLVALPCSRCWCNECPPALCILKFVAVCHWPSVIRYVMCMAALCSRHKQVMSSLEPLKPLYCLLWCCCNAACACLVMWGVCRCCFGDLCVVVCICIRHTVKVSAACVLTNERHSTCDKVRAGRCPYYNRLIGRHTQSIKQTMTCEVVSLTLRSELVQLLYTSDGVCVCAVYNTRHAQ
jgi:hypothetical protein